MSQTQLDVLKIYFLLEIGGQSTGGDRTFQKVATVGFFGQVFDVPMCDSVSLSYIIVIQGPSFVS